MLQVEENQPAGTDIVTHAYWLGTHAQRETSA